MSNTNNQQPEEFKPVRGQLYSINFYGKEKKAHYCGTNEDGIHCFQLVRKSKRPDGTSSKYHFTREDAIIRRKGEY